MEKGGEKGTNPFLVNNYDSLDMNNLSVNDTIQPKGVDKTPLGLVGLIKHQLYLLNIRFNTISCI